MDAIERSRFANNSLSAEEIYFRFWEREQEHTKTRWSVTTFFVSISFAIFGFSLQTSLPLCGKR